MRFNSSRELLPVALVAALATFSTHALALGNGFDPSVDPPDVKYSAVVKDQAWKFAGRLLSSGFTVSAVQISPNWILGARHTIPSQPTGTLTFQNGFGQAQVGTCYWPTTALHLVLCRLQSSISPTSGTSFPPLVENPLNLAPGQFPERYSYAAGQFLHVGFGIPYSGQARYTLVDAMGIRYGEAIPTSTAMTSSAGPYTAPGDSGSPRFWYPQSQDGHAGLIGVQEATDGVQLGISYLGLFPNTPSLPAGMVLTNSSSGLTKFSLETLQEISSTVSQNSSDSITINSATEFFGGTPTLAPGRIPNSSLKFQVSTSAIPTLQWEGVSDHPPSSYLLTVIDGATTAQYLSAFVPHLGGGVTHSYTINGMSVGHGYLACVVPTGPAYTALGTNMGWYGNGSYGAMYSYNTHCKPFFMSPPVNKMSAPNVSIVQVSMPAFESGYYYAAAGNWTTPTGNGTTSVVGYRVYSKIDNGPESYIDQIQPITTYQSAYVAPGAKACVAVAPITNPAMLGEKSDYTCVQAPAQ